MKVEQLVPAGGSVAVPEVLQAVRSQAGAFEPFAPELVDLCAGFSRRLFKDPEAARYPELFALAFWTRKAELERMRARFASMQSDDVMLAPRGVVFHIPPSNVDTIFVYSLFMSLLTGNANVVRLSRRAAPQSDVMCRVMNEELAAAGPALRDLIRIVRYGHDREISEAISAAADVRVIWGGDQTVAQMRAFPLPPHAKEITFPDRFSFSAIRTDAWLGLANDSEKATLAERFYNDTYWFDQMACSSPRLLVWCGPAGDVETARSDFYGHVARQVDRKRYAPQIGQEMNKLTFACRSIVDGAATDRDQFGKLSVVRLADWDALPEEHSGGGLLFEYVAEKLDDIGSHVRRRYQTLTQFGFTADELRRFTRSINGRGIDRIVPFGEALNFNVVWDGYDLLRELVRCVTTKA